MSGNIYRLPVEPTDTLSANDLETLKTLSALLGPNAVEEAEENDSDEDFHSIWIGLLLGSGAVANREQAYFWATKIRYDLSEAYGLTA